MNKLSKDMNALSIMGRKTSTNKHLRFLATVLPVLSLSAVPSLSFASNFEQSIIDATKKPINVARKIIWGTLGGIAGIFALYQIAMIAWGYFSNGDEKKIKERADKLKRGALWFVIAFLVTTGITFLIEVGKDINPNFDDWDNLKVN